MRITLRAASETPPRKYTVQDLKIETIQFEGDAIITLPAEKAFYLEVDTGTRYAGSRSKVLSHLQDRLDPLPSGQSTILHRPVRAGSTTTATLLIRKHLLVEIEDLAHQKGILRARLCSETSPHSVFDTPSAHRQFSASLITWSVAIIFWLLSIWYIGGRLDTLIANDANRAAQQLRLMTQEAEERQRSIERAAAIQAVATQTASTLSVSNLAKKLVRLNAATPDAAHWTSFSYQGTVGTIIAGEVRGDQSGSTNEPAANFFANAEIEQRHEQVGTHSLFTFREPPDGTQ